MSEPVNGPERVSSSAFDDLDAVVELPRVEGLWLSPDGRRLVVGVATADRVANRYTTALWEVDPSGVRPARRLTRGVEGESLAAFTPGGDLLFVSARPDPAGESAGSPSALWLQPAAGGDARVVARPPGAVRGVVISESGTIVLGSALLPSSGDPDSDRQRRAARETAKVSAILNEEYPIRYWDHDLGPARTRLLTGELGVGAVGGGSLKLADVTGHVGRALSEHVGMALSDGSPWDISPDGGTVVASWVVAGPGGSQRSTLVTIDVATGKRHTVADDADHDYLTPRVSPDGTQVVVLVWTRPTPEDPGDFCLGIVPIAGGPLRTVAADWDRWPHCAHWTPDGRTLIVTADHNGRMPVFRVDVRTGEVTRVTEDHGAYTDLQPSPDGQWIYALRSALDSPPAPVRISLDTGAVDALPGPARALGAEVDLPGRLAEVTTTAADGTELRGWLAVPHSASADAPAPLLLQIHGGPTMSANSWNYRWNMWMAVARGYAVLEPDYSLSTGYGIEFIRRGWSNFGGPPYADLMDITDAAQRRPDIDPHRSAAMGASYGGYLINWIAGHTDRFAALVSHASLWDMTAFPATSDQAHFFTNWQDKDSPHRFVDSISTPMLVVHGGNDYRVPIGEALHLWWDLCSRSKADDGCTPHKFLYFPDENHFIARPNNARLCYVTYLNFLDHHIHNIPWTRDELLR